MPRSSWMRLIARTSRAITGSTSVTAPITLDARGDAGAVEVVVDLRRASARACSATLSASGPRLARASLVMTLSGVFSAWARLPTWVRARSMISWFDSRSAFSSLTSGSISAGNAPSKRGLLAAPQLGERRGARGRAAAGPSGSGRSWR